LLKLLQPARCQILRLKCTKFDSPPQTPLGELTALPRLSRWILLREGEREGKRREGKGKGRGEGKEEEKEGRGKVT